MDCAYDLDHMNGIVLPPNLKTLLPFNLHPLCSGAYYKKQERLFLTDQVPQWMFFVIAGEVTLERIGHQGESVVLQRIRMGFVSEASISVSHYHCDAVSITDTNVIKVPIKELAASLDHDPSLASRWIHMLNSEVRKLRLHCERLSMKSVKDRLLHLIQTEGSSGHYAVPSGLKTLAGELGVTHEALYRAIAELEKKGLLHKSDGDLVLTL